MEKSWRDPEWDQSLYFQLATLPNTWKGGETESVPGNPVKFGISVNVLKPNYLAGFVNEKLRLGAIALFGLTGHQLARQTEKSLNIQCWILWIKKLFQIKEGFIAYKQFPLLKQLRFLLIFVRKID